MNLIVAISADKLFTLYNDCTFHTQKQTIFTQAFLKAYQLDALQTQCLPAILPE